MKSKTSKDEKTKAPTIVDVARAAKVGLGTASRALNDEGYVSANAARRVKAAAERLGYKPNEIARNLKGGRSGAIGVVLPDIGGPFMVECIRGAIAVLRENEYIPILAFTENNDKIEKQELDYLVRRQVDGFLIVPAVGKAAHLKSNILNTLPTVFFDQPGPGRIADSVLVQNKDGAKRAVAHLLDHGHRRIACVGIHEDLYTIRERIKGYSCCMEEAGCEDMRFIWNPADNGLAEQLRLWLQGANPPTAIFSLNEFTSIALLHELNQLRVRIPETLAFVGFDDIQLGHLLSITAVVQPAYEIGAQAATALLARVRGEASSLKKNVMLKTELVIRRSCGCKEQR